MSEKVSYARVSSAGQSLDVQMEKLLAAGATRVFKEKRSGRQADNRPELQACLSYVREGDTLMVTRLDRMARSVLDLAKIADLLQRKGVTLRVLDQGLDTSTSEGKLMFNLLGAFAEFEAEIRRERAADGVAMAKQKGIKFGRRKALNQEQVANLRRLHTEEGFSVAQLQIDSKWGGGPSTEHSAVPNESMGVSAALLVAGIEQALDERQTILRSGYRRSQSVSATLLATISSAASSDPLIL